MVKKIISFATAIFMLCCMIPFGAFADDILDDCPKCGKHTYETWKDYSTSVPDLGFPVSGKKRHCTSCKYSYYEWNVFGICGYKDFDNGGEGLIDGFFMDYLKDWCSKTFGKDGKASGFQTGGGSASPGGVGRRPDGYVDDSGTPYIGSSGVLYIAMEHDFIGFDGYNNNSYYCDHRNYTPPSSATLTPTYICRDDYMAMRVSSSSEKIYPDLYAGYKLVAPIDGYYSVVTVPQYSTICDSSQGRDFKYSGEFGVYLKDKFYPKDYVIKLSKKYSTHAKDGSHYYNSTFFRATISGSVILQVVPYEPIYKQQTNVTINNNTWNGNIYVDNTNKLTYIYPQYTINNETKISNNPIIYNEETKQYYTYDSVTNNYYYITYGDPAPTPTPSPSPDPGGSTPDPDKPTPTPTPAPTDNPSGDTNNFWNIIFPNFSDDGTDSGHKGIFWALVSLILAIIAFFTNMLAGYKYLFPFLPDGVVMTINACVFVLFLFVVIKFIMRSK